MNTTTQLSSRSPTRRAPAWIALVTTALCALGAVLWLGTRPDRLSTSTPAAVTAPTRDPALAEARAVRTAARREQIDRMQERIAKLEKIEQPGKRPPRVKTPRAPTPTPDRPIPPVTIDPECLRNPLCHPSR